MLGSATAHELSDEVCSVVRQAEPRPSEARGPVTLPTKRHRTAGGGGNDGHAVQDESLCLLDELLQLTGRTAMN